MGQEELAMASREPRVDILGFREESAAADASDDGDGDGSSESDGGQKIREQQDATDTSTPSSGSVASSYLSLHEHSDQDASSDSELQHDAAIQRRASAGHAVAQRFVSAHELVEQARVAYYEERAEGRALETLRRAVTLWRRLAVDQSFLNELLHVASSDSADACFAFAIGEDSTSALEDQRCSSGEAEVFWRQCAAAFPTVAVFKYWLALRLFESRKFHDALVFTDKALALERNPQWLYLRARCLANRPTVGLSERVDAFQSYIAKNPPDEEHVPEAYYTLALLYLEQGEYVLAKRYQALAQLAERPPVRFPSFGLVDDEFYPKLMLRLAFSRPLLVLSIEQQLACVETTELECECCHEWVPLLSLLRHKMWVCKKRHIGCLLCGVSMEPDMLFPHQELVHSPS